MHHVAMGAGDAISLYGFSIAEVFGLPILCRDV